MREDNPQAALPETRQRSAGVIVAAVFIGLGLTWVQPLNAQTGAVAVPRHALWLLPSSAQELGAPIQNQGSSGSVLKGALIGAAIGGVAGEVVFEVASAQLCPHGEGPYPSFFGGTATCTVDTSRSRVIVIGVLVGGVIGGIIGRLVGSSGESERSWTAIPYVSSSSQLGLRTQWSMPWPGP